MIAITQYLVHEWTFSSNTVYADPFNDVELDILLTDKDGKTITIPAFWSDDQIRIF